jgi:hypothetical protein
MKNCLPKVPQRIHANSCTNPNNRLTPWKTAYWVKKGSTEKDAVLLVSLWNSGVLCGRGFDRFRPEAVFESLYSYRKAVSFYTQMSYVEFRNLLDQNNERGVNMHIDHIFSVAQGLRNRVPPAILGSVYNLRLTTGKENRKKSSCSDISETTLITLFLENHLNQSRYYHQIIEEAIRDEY